MDVKMVFEEPQMKVVNIEVEDVITDSPGSKGIPLPMDTF